MKIYYGECTAALASFTYAVKARNALAARGLYAEVVRLDSSHEKRGCGFGVEFSCGDSDSVKKILRNARIEVRRYLRGGGEPV